MVKKSEPTNGHNSGQGAQKSSFREKIWIPKEILSKMGIWAEKVNLGLLLTL